MTYDTINDAVTMQGGDASVLGRIDKYELVRELGEGGFGVVYLAHDTVAKTDAAVKGLPPEVKHNPAELESIRGNFALVKRLRHPNIVAVTDLHLAQSVRYLSKDAEEKLRVFPRDTMVVMDYAPGLTLAQWRKKFQGCRVPVAKALEVVRQVASALDYAHGQKVLHRDVKPANVMVEESSDGRLAAHVLDFGLAAEIRSSMGRVSREIRDTSGTRPYMAPEQWLGKKQGPATDQYSLAVLFYELVVGEVPFASVFDCGDTAVMRLAVTTDTPEIPSSLPKNVRRALAVALAKKPEERFASCGDLVAALEGRKVSRRGADARNGGMGKALGVIALVAALLGGAWWMKEEAKGTGDTESRPIASVPAEKAIVEPAPDDSAVARERATEFVRLKTRINIKVSDAREKLKRIGAFRADPDGLVSHIKSADEQKKVLDALVTPNNLEEAKTAFELADKAETQIALDLDWLVKNKAGRDAAKSAEAEIDGMMSGDIAKFKAERYAARQFNEGKSLLAKGRDSFGKGDFAEAGRLLGEAKTRFAEAAREAKAFFVSTTLESAREYAGGGKWQQCVEECDKVLGWDSDNAEAKRQKKDAEHHLVPSLRVVAKIGGREVEGVKVTIDGKDYKTPVGWEKLKDGATLGPYEASYESGGKRYFGKFDAVTVDWRGQKTIAVAMKEYTGPKEGDNKTFTLPGGVPMEMVYVAPGSFTMGSTMGHSDEKPHQVRITKGYWIGKYPVTQRQWESLVSANGITLLGSGSVTPYFSRHGAGSARVAGLDTSDFPMESISWNDCDALVKGLNRAEKGGRKWSMPTEAQWEFAAKGGNKSIGYTYSGGNNLDALGWYYDNSGVRRLSDSDWKFENLESNKCRTHSVKEKDVGNELGIVGMSGNVWEWCYDWYDADYYKNSPTDDPQGPASGSDRVRRGGGWNYIATYCRSAYRYYNYPSYRISNIGFRLCCSAGLRE